MIAWIPFILKWALIVMAVTGLAIFVLVAIHATLLRAKDLE